MRRVLWLGFLACATACPKPQRGDMFMATRPPDAFKPHRGGIGWDGQFHAAPMGLKTLILRWLYHKHGAPTELATAPND